MKIRQTDVRRFLQLAGKFWESSFKDDTPTIVLTLNATSYSIAMTKHGLLLTYLCNRLDSKTRGSTLTAPFELLRDCSVGNGIVDLQSVEEDGHSFVVAKWNDGPVLCEQKYPMRGSPGDYMIPDLAWHTVDERLMRSLANATEVTNEASTRYSLSCVELDGSQGTVTATDSKQLFQVPMRTTSRSFSI